jgi:hypothetical protein
MAIDPTRDVPEAAPPDPALMRTIRASASRLTLLEGTFISRLHEDIAALIPGLAADGRAFCERMVRSVLWAVVTDQSPRAAADAFRWVGAVNWTEGFPEDQYVSIAHALVRTVRELSGDNWSASTSSAWITYFLWIQPHLLAGARQAAAQHSGQEPERPGASPAPYDRPAQAAHGDAGLDSASMPRTPRFEELTAVPRPWP